LTLLTFGCLNNYNNNNKFMIEILQVFFFSVSDELQNESDASILTAL